MSVQLRGACVFVCQHGVVQVPDIPRSTFLASKTEADEDAVLENKSCSCNMHMFLCQELLDALTE